MLSSSRGTTREAQDKSMGKKRKSSELLLKSNKKDSVGSTIKTAAFTADDDDVMQCLAELDEKQGVVVAQAAASDPSSSDNNNDNKNSSNSQSSEEAVSKFEHQQQQRYAGLLNDFNALNAPMEVTRHNLASKLSRWLIESCGSNLRIASFERWIMDCKIEEAQKLSKSKTCDDTAGIRQNRQLYRRRREKNKRDKPRGVDVVLPSMPHIQDRATQNLLQEVIAALTSSLTTATTVHSNNNGNVKAAAKSICIELCAKSMKYVRALENLAERQHQGSAKNNIKLERTSSHQYSLVLERANKTTFCVRINTMHYNKLFQVFTLQYPNHDISVFHLLIFVMIVRYSTMAGGQQCCLKDARGGGMQGAIHNEVFDFLKQFFFSSSQDNHNFLLLECFASPLNTYCLNGSGTQQQQQQRQRQHYCSAFPDIGEVSAFGSIGNFFHIPVGSLPDGCCCEANPPFAPLLMSSMAQRIEEHLKSSLDQKKTLIFVVIVPTTKANTTSNVEKAARESFLLLQNSKFLQKHIILKSKEHGYIEASQHIRHTQFKESQYDTSVFLLATSYNGFDTSLLSVFEDGIRKAFASMHKEELMERRKKITNSGSLIDAGELEK